MFQISSKGRAFSIYVDIGRNLYKCEMENLFFFSLAWKLNFLLVPKDFSLQQSVVTIGYNLLLFVLLASEDINRIWISILVDWITRAIKCVPNLPSLASRKGPGIHTFSRKTIKYTKDLKIDLLIYPKIVISLCSNYDRSKELAGFLVRSHHWSLHTTL